MAPYIYRLLLASSQLLENDGCEIGAFRGGARRGGVDAQLVLVIPTSLFVGVVGVRLACGFCFTGLDFLDQDAIAVDLDSGRRPAGPFLVGMLNAFDLVTGGAKGDVAALQGGGR